jgi:hypothetical protein
VLEFAMIRSGRLEHDASHQELAASR